MIYFIQEEVTKSVKIGYSTSILKRLVKMQTDNSQELKVIRTIENGTKEQERRIHFRYRDLHIRGEWFHYEDSMLTIDPNEITVTYGKEKQDIPYAVAFTVAEDIEERAIEAIDKISKEDTMFISKAFLAHYLNLSTTYAIKFFTPRVVEYMNLKNKITFGTDSTSKFKILLKLSLNFQEGTKWSYVCVNAGVAMSTCYSHREIVKKFHENYKKINQEKLAFI